MNLQQILLSTSGRISRKQFWIGILVLIAVSFVVGLVVGMAMPGNLLIPAIVGLIFLYPAYCLYAKRFQDMGKPATLALVPVGISLIMNGASILAGLGMMSAPAGGMPGMVLPMWLSLILGLVGLAFLIWAGATKGQDGPNQYGPDPLAQAA